MLTPFTSIGAAALNAYAGIISHANLVNNLSTLGGNISGALLDNVSLGLAPSATDSTLFITSVGNEVVPTLTKVNATMEFSRDVDTAQTTGVYNLAWQLMSSPDIHYIIADRSQGGKKSTSTFAAGDVVSFYSARTNQGIDKHADQKFTTFTQTFITDGISNVNVSIGA